MTRVLVTGGAGYLGSTLTWHLLQQNYHVTVVDTFAHGAPSLAHVCFDTRLKIIRGDARDMGLMEPLLKQTDIFIPLAAIVGAPACDFDPVGAKTLNLDAVYKSLRILSPEQAVLIPTTNSGYGIGGETECTEESPLRPLTLYGRTKVDAEALVMHHKNAISLRLATVFGISPRMRFDLLVNDFVRRAVHDRVVVLFEPHFRRNYIHVRDVSRAFIYAIDHLQWMKGEVYNVGLSDANLTKAQLCERIKEHIPEFTWLEAPVGEDPDKRDYLVSNAKIEKAGFYPRYNLGHGIAELIKGLRMFPKVEWGNV